MSALANAAEMRKPGYSGEFFPGIGKISYEGPQSRNVMAFKHYNADEVVMGRTMREWCRFTVCWWHTFRGTGADPFGSGTITRPWDDGTESVENAIRRCRAAFEFFTKLGIDHYSFHDRDIAPEGKTLEESNANLDAVVDELEKLQAKTGIKLLWGTQNMFSNPRFMCGAATNPDAHIFAYAAAQTKKVMEVTHRLKGENLVFWGGREGYQSILNTNVKRELDHLARFFHMVVAYKKKIGATYQLLIEPKPREPMKHQYDYDAQTVIGFLHTYGLQDHFKLNIEPNHTTLAGHDYEHDLLIASKFNMLGSIDCNTGDTLLGWDTDQFLYNEQGSTPCIIYGRDSSITATSLMSKGEVHGVSFVYGDGDPCVSDPSNLPVSFQLNLECDNTVSKGDEPHVSTASGAVCIETVTIRSSANCPSTVTSLSPVLLLAIILVGAITLYLIVGIVFKSQVMGTSGVESIPNVDFWREFPTNVRIGCRALWAWANGRDLGDLGLGEASGSLLGAGGGGRNKQGGGGGNGDGDNDDDDDNDGDDVEDSDDDSEDDEDDAGAAAAAAAVEEGSGGGAFAQI